MHMLVNTYRIVCNKKTNTTEITRFEGMDSFGTVAARINEDCRKKEKKKGKTKKIGWFTRLA